MVTVASLPHQLYFRSVVCLCEQNLSVSFQFLLLLYFYFPYHEYDMNVTNGVVRVWFAYCMMSFIFIV